MIEKMLVEYAKLKRQRSMYISIVMTLMSKEFEGEDIGIFKRAVATQILDILTANDCEMMLKDASEQQMFKDIKVFLEKEEALLSIQKFLNGDQPL